MIMISWWQLLLSILLLFVGIILIVEYRLNTHEKMMSDFIERKQSYLVKTVREIIIELTGLR